MLAAKTGVPVAEVPVRWREVAGSKVGLVTPPHMAWEILLAVLGEAGGWVYIVRVGCCVLRGLGKT